MLRLTRRKWAVGQRKSGEKGAILVVALIVLAFAGLMIPPTLAHIGTGTKAVDVQRDATTRVYSADAGVEYALRWLASGGTAGSCPPEITPPPNDMQKVTMNITGNNIALGWDNYKIESTATDSESRETKTVVYAHVNPLTVDVLKYGVFALGDGVDGASCADSDVHLQGNAQYGPSEVVANRPAQIYADGDVCLEGSVEVTGDAFATGDITVGGSSEITGNAVESAPTIPAPDMGIGARAAAVRGLDYGSGVIYLGNKLIASNTTFDGPVKVEGNLTIKAQGNSTIVTVNFNKGLWVTGDLNVDGQGKVIINLGSDVYVGVEGAPIGGYIGPVNAQTTLDVRGGYAVIAEQNISINGGANINNPPYPAAADLPLFASINGGFNIKGGSNVAGILYAPNGTLNLGGNANLYGISIAEKIVGMGGNKITYPVDAYGMASFPAVGAGQITIKYWKVNPD